MKHTLSVLVEDESGVLSRISGLFARRGFNIESLAVGPAERDGVSRLTMVVEGDERTLSQMSKQLNKLINVLEVNDLTRIPAVERELMLVKVRATGKDREEMKRVSDIFRGHIIDVTDSAYVIELTGTSNKLDSFVAAIDPVLILETVRSGVSGIGRGDRMLKV